MLPSYVIAIDKYRLAHLAWHELFLNFISINKVVIDFIEVMIHQTQMFAHRNTVLH